MSRIDGVSGAGLRKGSLMVGEDRRRIIRKYRRRPWGTYGRSLTRQDPNPMPDSPTERGESRSERFRETMRATAYLRVKAAIRRGDLVNPGKCEECGSDRAVNGHHDDYSKPLSVRWLCQKCHSDWHTINGAGLHADKKAVTRVCEECGGRIAPGSRSDRRFCSEKCRRQAFERVRNSATVFRTTRLKSGKISVVLHLEYPTLRPGDRIRWVRD